MLLYHNVPASLWNWPLFKQQPNVVSDRVADTPDVTFCPVPPMSNRTTFGLLRRISFLRMSLHASQTCATFIRFRKGASCLPNNLLKDKRFLVTRRRHRHRSLPRRTLPATGRHRLHLRNAVLEAVQQTAKELVASTGGAIEALVCDVRYDEHVEAHRRYLGQGPL